MAVSCKKSLYKQSEEFIEITCKPCEDDGEYTAASGLCRECEENMCNTCFGHHRKAKVCKGHVLIDCAGISGGENNKADEDLDNLEKDISNCNIKIQQCFTAIQTKRSQAEEMHVKFIADAETFKNEIFQHVNKLSNEIGSQAACLKTQNMHSIDRLEKDATSMAKEMSLINETFETQRNQPNKPFVTPVQLKQKVRAFQLLIEEIRNKNTIQGYIFERDSQLENALTACNNFGLVQCIPGGGNDIDTTIERSLSQSCKLMIQTNTEVSNLQPLRERKLRAENIDVDGEFLSFSRLHVTTTQNGLYIGNTIMTEGNYFEVEIMNCGGSEGSVGIGLVPKDYPETKFPGWYNSSVGYHSDDGCVFIQNDSGKSLGLPCSDNDRMGCGVSEKTNLSLRVFFTRNGRKFCECPLLQKNASEKPLYPAVALDTFGQKVKVTLDARRQLFE